MIHWKLLHRLYLSPLKRFYMHVSPSPNCNLCPQGALGTYFNFFGGMRCTFSFLVSACSWHIIPIRKKYSPQQRNLLLAALTAAERMLVSRWVPPHLMIRCVWGLSLLDIVSIELSTARIHGAKTKTLKTWNAIFDIIKSFVSSFWCINYFECVYIFYIHIVYIFIYL